MQHIPSSEREQREIKNMWEQGAILQYKSNTKNTIQHSLV